MGRYVVKRLFFSIPLLLMISFVTFVLINLSSMDPAETILHARDIPQITDELIAQTKDELGLDNSFIVRYLHWLMDIVRLDFGYSYTTGKPVWSLMAPAFLNTFKLTCVASVVIILLSILLGIVCALNVGKWVDKTVRGISFFLTSMPPYWLGSLLIWYFSVKLDLLPTSGMQSYQSYILPVSVISIGYAGIYFRNVRSAMLSNLNEDYVLYGRACGLSERKIIKHIVRNSMGVAVSIFCMAIPTILGGTVVIENVFAWPGLGSLSVKSIMGRDFPMIQAYVLMLGVAFVGFNTIADLIQAALNPRLRKEIQ